MSEHPNHLRYTEDHEWLLLDGNGNAKVGITHYAQTALGDIVYVELPEVGDALAKGDVLGVVESVKATSDIYLPVAGSVVAINEALVESPETLNSDPHEAGWLLSVKLDDPTQAEGLMSAEDYGKFLAKLDH